MGFRHVVTLTFRDDTTTDQHEAALAAVHTLPGQISEISSYVVGLDAGLNPGNASLAIVADFASAEDYLVYRDHPAHQQVIADVLLPLIAARSAVQHHT